ncbi:MAG: dTDP-4-dehydrorhamnose reductase [Candidatus Baltobacteraceae bacterium]
MRDIGRVCVVGSSGQLGHDVVEAFKGCEVTGLTHDDISIEDASLVARALEGCRPDVVINTAAYHHVPTCETHQREALLINAAGVANLAGACARRGAIFATVSTDYVFDGTKGSPYLESDEPHPLSVYGLSKLAGETIAQATLPSCFVFRTSGLFGKLGSKSKGYTFIDRILQQARDGAEIKVVNDMTFSPSYTTHVAAAIRAVIERAPFGLYHLTNRGATTWYDFARAALNEAGFDRVPITATSLKDYNDGVRRPQNSSLAHEALLRAALTDLPPWQEAVADYVRERFPS